MSLQFNEDSKYMAAGMMHGGIYIYNLHYGEIETRIDWPNVLDESEKAFVELGPNDTKFPVTCIKWQPRYGGLRGGNIFAASYGNNIIKIWDTSRKDPKHIIVESGNTGVYCIDYNSSGSLLVSGGADATLRIYDDPTKKVIKEFQPGLKDIVHHHNRIHCVKFNPEDDNIIYSGGADKQITVHDMRWKDPLQNIIGPYVIGDSIDINNNSLLVGSYRSKEWLEVYDIRKYERINVYDWDQDHPRRGGQVLAAKFTKGRTDSILAAGKSLNDIRVFNRASGAATAGLDGFKNMIYSMDYNHDGSLISLGSADGTIYMLEYV